MVHDHDTTFYNYGGNHQECLEHVRRYLKDSIVNESNLKWNSQMLKLVNEMIHFKNSLDPNDQRHPDQIALAMVASFEAVYDEILKLAETEYEYEYEPPSKYYMEGFNLFKRLAKYKTNHLLFLHDKNVEPTNNLSERLLRNFKRKQQQAMSFRSWDGLDYLCNSLGIIASICNHGESLFECVASLFAKPLVSDFSF